MANTCTHLDQIQDVEPSAQGCEECLKMGSSWVHLRICKICGHVGCCDSSPNKHATAHFHETQHPSIQSFEPGENWLWCYVDKAFMQPSG
ncbi:MAG: UBP-type zinc finger domain-containing protein [bacterium]|nr:UBP-type zinc finger domain-containing protein [bacterium]